MGTQKEKLVSFGFNRLPEFNPDYFKHREKVGFLLLLNEKEKLSYQLFTINGQTCLHSARKAVLGEKSDRAHDFREALKKSELKDWVIYFRPNGLYPGLRDCVQQLISGYKSLNTNRSRVNPSEATWIYQVTHDESKRSLAISSNRPLLDEEAIGRFLRKWRATLDQSLSRRAISLNGYYFGCRKLGEATAQWMGGHIKNFTIFEVPELAGQERQLVVKHAALENVRQGHVYKRSLAA